MKINHNTHNLAIAVFNAFGTDSEQAVEQTAAQAEQALQSDYKRLFDALVSGEISYFYYETMPTCARRGLVEVWTLSARPGVLVQHTTFMRVHETGELLPLSHSNIVTFSDMVKDSMPDNVEILTA